MGKKAYQISKSSNKEKHQLQRLVKVLKPRVYITESFKFKKLVQELTGNGNNSIASSPDFMEIKVAEEVVFPLVNHKNVIRDQTEYQYKCKSSRSRGSSVEAPSPVNSDFTFDHHQSENHNQISVEVSNSTDESTASPLSRYTSSSVDQDYDLSDLQFCVDNTSLQEYSTPHELEDLFAYQEIDSSLLDNAETSSLYDCFAQIEQEVSFYDNEFAGLFLT